MLEMLINSGNKGNILEDLCFGYFDFFKKIKEAKALVQLFLLLGRVSFVQRMGY